MGREFTTTKSDGVKIHQKKRSEEVRVHREKQRWGESSPLERAMG